MSGFLRIDPANDAEALPRLFSGNWIGFYDFTSTASLGLVAGSRTPGYPNKTGIPDKIVKAYNRLNGVAGAAPDLVANATPNAYYGFQLQGMHRNGRSAAFCGPNERGLSTPSATLTMAGGTATTNQIVAGTTTCQVSTTGSLPQPLSTTATYYPFVNADGTVSLATTGANATGGIPNNTAGGGIQDIILAGTGSISVAPSIPAPPRPLFLFTAGSGTLTLTFSSPSVTDTATLNWSGLPMSGGQLYAYVDVIDLTRGRQYDAANSLAGGAKNNTYYGISGAGATSLGFIHNPATGAASAPFTANANTGRPAIGLRSVYNVYDSNMLETGDRTGQVLVIVRFMSTANGSTGAGSMPTYVNGSVSSQAGDKYVADTLPLSQVVVGNVPAAMNNDWRSHAYHYYHGIIALPSSPTSANMAADAAAITAHFKAVLAAPLGQAIPWVMLWGASGQSNGANRMLDQNGSPYANYGTATYASLLGWNAPHKLAEGMLMRLFGSPSFFDISGCMTTGTAANPGKCGGESENNSSGNTSSATLNATPFGLIDDISGAVTPTDPTTWKPITGGANGGDNSFTSLGALVQGFSVNVLQRQGLTAPSAIYTAWVQGENTLGGWTKAQYGANWNISGSPIANYTPVQLAGRRVQFLKMLPATYASYWNNTAMRIFIQSTAIGNNYVQGGPLWAADQIAIDQDTTGKLFNGNACPPHYAGFPQLHYPDFAYDGLCMETARKEAWVMQQKGEQPSNSVAGPAYGQSPRLTGILATAGGSYIDFVFSNPNGAGSLTITNLANLKYWMRAAYGCTSNNIASATAPTGATTQAQKGIFWNGGTNIAWSSSQSPVLIAPFTVRMYTAAALPASGSQLVGWYADAQAMAGAVGNVDPTGAMLTDNAGTTCAAEPYITPVFRNNMPAQIETCGVLLTL